MANLLMTAQQSPRSAILEGRRQPIEPGCPIISPGAFVALCAMEFRLQLPGNLKSILNLGSYTN